MNKEFNSIRYAEDFPVNKVEEIRIGKILKQIGSNKSVLDVGCGDGFIMERIKAQGNIVTGIEIAQNAVRKCQEKGLEVFDVSLNDVWSEKINRKFDVVFAGEIIEHVFDTDNFLINIRKVLNEHGRLIITTPNMASLGRRILLMLGKNPLIETTARKYDAGHIRYFTQDSLKKLLLENKYKISNLESTVINFMNKEGFYSKLAADIFPRLGNNIIVSATVEQ